MIVSNIAIERDLGFRCSQIESERMREREEDGIGTSREKEEKLPMKQREENIFTSLQAAVAPRKS